MTCQTHTAGPWSPSTEASSNALVISHWTHFFSGSLGYYSTTTVILQCTINWCCGNDFFLWGIKAALPQQLARSVQVVFISPRQVMLALMRVRPKSHDVTGGSCDHLGHPQSREACDWIRHWNIVYGAGSACVHLLTDCHCYHNNIHIMYMGREPKLISFQIWIYNCH